MSGLSIYDQSVIDINGRYLEQATGITTEFVDGDDVIHLLGAGTKKWLLLEPKGRMLRISWDMCCPSDDTDDLRFIRQWREVEQVQIGITMLGSRSVMVTRGYLSSPKLTARVGATLLYQCGAICDVGDFG